VVGVNKSGNAVSIDWRTASSKQVDQAYNYTHTVHASDLPELLFPVETAAIQGLSSLGPQGASTAAAMLPSLDGTGKVHGELPDHVPDNWTREDLEQLGDELRQSIQKRKEV
jgi:hypothetical protein